jgi:acyl-CoA-binding protein
MQANFDKAAEDIKSVINNLTNDEKLEVYGLFK